MTTTLQFAQPVFMTRIVSFSVLIFLTFVKYLLLFIKVSQLTLHIGGDNFGLERQADVIPTRMTIGIGAGNGCDGQVLVYQDMLGYTDGFTPKFVKKYADLHSVMLEAFKQYKQECEQRSFPEAGQTYAISEEVMQALFETEIEEVKRS